MSGRDERINYKFHIEKYGGGPRNNPVPGRTFTEECILVDTRDVPDWVDWEGGRHFLSDGENHRRNKNGTISRDIRYPPETYWFIIFLSLEEILEFARDIRRVHIMIESSFRGCSGSITLYD